MATLQERIKERRNQKGFTLLDLAERLNIKEATVQRYESGEIKNVKHETIVKLAEIMDCTPQYLMGWVDTPKDNTFIQEFSMNKKKLLSDFDQLNPSGQRKAIEYVSDLADSPKYTPNTIAAHTDSPEYSEADLSDIERAKKLIREMKSNDL